MHTTSCIPIRKRTFPTAFKLWYATLSLEKLQESGLKFVYNNYTTPYVDFLRKAHIPPVSPACQRSAVIEVYKALNGLSPKYMPYMFTLNKTNHNLRSNNKILLPKCHITNFGLKSFAYQAGSLWNKLPNSHWKILRQILSLGQLTMTCDIYILPSILTYQRKKTNWKQCLGTKLIGL